MVYTLTAPHRLNACIALPTSKSISNRVLIINALSGNRFPVDKLSESDDTRVMVQAFETPNGRTIDIGAAGTSMRFLTAYLSQREGEWVLTGSERMKNRPIRLLVDALRSLGAEIAYLEKDGFPPLHIRGKQLNGGSVTLDGSVSSQYISALLMVAPTMDEGLTLHLSGRAISQPYIRMTLSIMKQYGVAADWKENTIHIPPQPYRAIPYTVESDWSAASYWYEMVALAPEATIGLTGLRADSLQGDAQGRFLFEQLGVKTVFTDEGVLLEKQPPTVRRIDYDFVQEPDLAQSFVVTCCLMDIPFRFTGLQSLRIKETDRIAALQQEMRKLGYVLEASENSILEWRGERIEPSREPIATYEDHRMAMAFAPACLRMDSVSIADPEVVSKSYPRYWDDLKRAGVSKQSFEMC